MLCKEFHGNYTFWCMIFYIATKHEPCIEMWWNRQAWMRTWKWPWLCTCGMIMAPTNQYRCMDPKMHACRGQETQEVLHYNPPVYYTVQRVELAFGQYPQRTKVTVQPSLMKWLYPLADHLSPSLWQWEKLMEVCSCTVNTSAAHFVVCFLYYYVLQYHFTVTGEDFETPIHLSLFHVPPMVTMDLLQKTTPLPRDWVVFRNKSLVTVV